MAVGVVIGAAFGSVVSALVSDLFIPLIAAIAKVLDFSGLALISFLLVASAIFFFVVKPMNILIARSKKEPQEPTTKKCKECLSEIPKDAKRCSYCTQIVV